MSRFLQLHTLASYPGTLLNRDDAGFAKRLPWGGVTRTRVSSQCLKRHWRTYDGLDGLRTLEQPMSVRSRHAFSRKVYQPLLDQGHPELLTLQVVRAIMTRTLGGKVKLTDKIHPREALQSSQLVVLGEPELTYFQQLAVDFLRSHADKLPLLSAMPCPQSDTISWSADHKKELAVIEDFFNKNKDLGKNLEGVNLASGLDAALFGRMVTSDIISRGDAAIHVAHAITVHAEASESDYFSAIDELLREDHDGELGSGHINSSELTSGLFYVYVVIDLPLLVSNLTGCRAEDWLQADRTLAAQVVARLIPMIATVSPGAKKGATAPYAHAHMVLAEWSDTQPRTLANAFLKPVTERPDLLANTYDALTRYLHDWSAMYGPRHTSRLAAMGSSPQVLALADALRTQNSSLADLTQACHDQILGAL